MPLILDAIFITAMQGTQFFIFPDTGREITGYDELLTKFYIPNLIHEITVILDFLIISAIHYA